ncbi:MAG: hypothetical protein WDN72_00785 [Alphaproteobacteria bacterium]
MISSSRAKRWWKRAREMHRGLLLVVLALGLLGVVMQYSAAGGDARVFALPQALKLLLGFVLMVLPRGDAAFDAVPLLLHRVSGLPRAARGRAGGGVCRPRRAALGRASASSTCSRRS